MKIHKMIAEEKVSMYDSLKGKDNLIKKNKSQQSFHLQRRLGLGS